MIRFLFIRLAQVLVVLAIMSFVVYALIGLMPGDPIDLMITADPHLTAADAARLKALYGLDRPLGERYLAWAGAALSGDFGYSRLYSMPTLAALLPRLGNSALLMGTSFVLALAIALPLGAAAARRPGSAFDGAVNFLSFAGISVPPFWLALLFILLFAAELGWLPAGGIATIGDENRGQSRLFSMQRPTHAADGRTWNLLPVASAYRNSIFVLGQRLPAFQPCDCRLVRAHACGELRFGQSGAPGADQLGGDLEFGDESVVFSLDLGVG